MSYSIYIADDEKNIRDIIKSFLERDGYIVSAFENGDDLMAAFFKKPADLVILDIMLPDEDGLSVLKKLKATPLYKNIPVIMVTAKTSEIDAVKGLDLGADDYITKPFGVMELVSRVKAVLRRTQRSIVDNLAFKNIIIDEAKHIVFVGDNEIELTYKEYEILKLLIINKGIVMTRDRLMETIWGYDFEQGNRTVDVHIQSLRKKLGDAGDYIKTIRNVGYKIGE